MIFGARYDLPPHHLSGAVSRLRVAVRLVISFLMGTNDSVILATGHRLPTWWPEAISAVWNVRFGSYRLNDRPAMRMGEMYLLWNLCNLNSGLVPDDR